MTQTNQLLLIDLSGIAHQLWHVSGSEPDPNFVSVQTVARVRALASNHPYAAVCCDNGKSFRKDIDPTYKANRDTENRAPLFHQMTLACETLKRDGFPVWSVKGFEADDLIATATTEALKIDGATVLIASADKDLLQLVNDRVQQKKTSNDATLMDVDAVRDKFKVLPTQMRDYLCLVGDKSDNIVGAAGIGGVRAAALLSAYGSLDAVYDAFDKGATTDITPAQRTSLQELRARIDTVRQLVTLRTDAPIPFHEIAVERTAPPMEQTPMEGFIEETPADVKAAEQRKAEREMSADEATAALGAVATKVAERIQPRATDIAQPPTPGSLAPVEFSQQLEPRSMTEAVQLAQRIYDSKLNLGQYGAPQAVLAVVLAGRELGLPAMASLRAFHIIEGKPSLSAGIIQSLVLKSGKARTFRCTERTALRATFLTQRGDDPEMSLTYTIEEGRAAFVGDDAKWNKSGWGRNPADMLVARASSKLARLVYPDVVSGLYAPEEMD